MHFADNVGPDQRAHLQSNVGIFCSSIYTIVSTDFVSGQREGPDQTVLMHRLIWGYVVHKLQKGLFVRCASYLYQRVPSYAYYENTPIQIYRKFHLKLKIFIEKTLIFFVSYFCSKHRLW